MEFMDLMKSACEFLIDISFLTPEPYDRVNAILDGMLILASLSSCHLLNNSCAKYLERKIVLVNASTRKK